MCIRNSILTEFHRYSLLEYNLLRHAKLDVVEEKVIVCLSLEDTVRGASETNEEIYRHSGENCLMSAAIYQFRLRLEFHEKEASRYRKNADIKMQNEVENVIRLSSFGAKRQMEGEYIGN